MAKGNLPDVRRTAAELKAHEASDRKRWSAVERAGIHVHLDYDHLRKMGQSKPPKAGSHVKIHAKARVKHVETRHDADGKPRHHVELELTHAHMEPVSGSGKSIKDSIDEALAQSNNEAGDFSQAGDGDGEPNHRSSNP